MLSGKQVAFRFPHNLDQLEPMKKLIPFLMFLMVLWGCRTEEASQPRPIASSSPIDDWNDWGSRLSPDLFPHLANGFRVDVPAAEFSETLLEVPEALVMYIRDVDHEVTNRTNHFRFVFSEGGMKINPRGDASPESPCSSVTVTCDDWEYARATFEEVLGDGDRDVNIHIQRSGEKLTITYEYQGC